MDNEKRSFIEKIEVTGDQLVTKVKDLFHDADAKRVVIRNSEDHELLSIPLTFGVAGGALLAFTAPMLAAVAAVGGAVAKLKLDVERTGTKPPAAGGDVDPTL